MKTDPLYQLNSDEKASLWKYKELLKQKEGFPALPKLLRSVNWTLSYEVKAMMRILPGWAWPEKETRTAPIARFKLPMYSSKKFCS